MFNDELKALEDIFFSFFIKTYRERERVSERDDRNLLRRLPDRKDN